MRTRTKALQIAAAALLTGLATLLLLTPTAQADRRAFAYTYGYMTLPKGGFEAEHYLDAKIARRDNPDTLPNESIIGADFRHQVELEYGITDRWDFGLYNVFEQKQFGGFNYRGAKLRTRYRFGDEGRWFVDPAIYGELVVYTDQVKLEQIIIMAKKFSRFELAVNLKFEQGWKITGPDKDFKFEFVPSLGFAWHIAPWIAVGFEYVGKVEVAGKDVEHAHFLGPVVNVSGKRFYWTLGFQPEIASSDGKRLKYQARSVFGVLF